MASLDALAHSEPILTRIIAELVRLDPSLRLALLAECGRTVHGATANVLFQTVVLPDDDAHFGSSSGNDLGGIGPASALVRNVARYAPRIRTLVVVDPLHASENPENTLFELESPEDEENEDEDGIRPISALHVQGVLEQCGALEELVWAASVPPPDGICETLSIHTPNLKRFTFAPSSPPSGSPLAPPLRWDARSLSLLPPLNYLYLTRLSQAGASALASHPPDVHHLSLDFVWLDDWVCERLARMPRVKRVTLGTGGTKLTERGVGALLEGLDALEVFELVEVQGRLSKTLWANVELPSTLHTLKVALSESGPHHSWTADHLLSFPSLVGLDQLSRISVTRTYSGNGQVDDVAVAKPVPSDVVDALRGCARVKHLECDWWAWGMDDLKELIEGCVNLETLRITLDAPFARLLSLTSSFAHLSYLSHLYVTVPSTHAPSTPPSPTLPTPGMSPLANRVNGIVIGSPTNSPLLLTRSLKSPKLVMPVPLPTNEDGASPITPGGAALSLGTANGILGAGNMNETIDTGADSVLPPLRDVRKFMRRCPKLVLLEWFGRTGRGAWVAHREDAKSVAGIKVEYVPPIVDEEAAAGMSGIYPHPGVGLVPREGAEWKGPEADVAAEAVREYEAERDGEIEREKEARRRRPSVGVKDSSKNGKMVPTTPRRRGATVSVMAEVNAPGKPRRRQSSASEGLGKAKVRGMHVDGRLRLTCPQLPVSPGCRRAGGGARRSP